MVFKCLKKYQNEIKTPAIYKNSFLFSFYSYLCKMLE